MLMGLFLCSSPRPTDFHFEKMIGHQGLILILKVLLKHLHLSKDPFSLPLWLFGLFGSSGFPLHCVLDTMRLLTGKPHALLTTVPLEGRSLLRHGWVLALHFSDCCFFGPKPPLSMLKIIPITGLTYLLLTTHRLKG